MITADLTDKKVLITGATSGIGKATAVLFARLGAQVVASGLPNDAHAETAIGEFEQLGLGDRIDVMPGDISSESDAARMVNEAIDHLGGLNYLVNNAGTPAKRGKEVDYNYLDFYTEAFWQKVITTNLYGPFYCARAAAPALRASKGAIVSTSSTSGASGGGSLSYSSSKAGLNILTRNLAAILAPDVRVNAVAPGLVDTPWTAGFSTARKEGSVRTSMIPRILQPEEVAEVILFLCAGPAMVNAQVVTIDGGRY